MRLFSLGQPSSTRMGLANKNAARSGKQQEVGPRNPRPDTVEKELREYSDRVRSIFDLKGRYVRKSLRESGQRGALSS
jgi:hypothetical protein